MMNFCMLCVRRYHWYRIRFRFRSIELLYFWSDVDVIVSICKTGPAEGGTHCVSLSFMSLGPDGKFLARGKKKSMEDWKAEDYIISGADRELGKKTWRGMGVYD